LGRSGAGVGWAAGGQGVGSGRRGWSCAGVRAAAAKVAGQARLRLWGVRAAAAKLAGWPGAVGAVRTFGRQLPRLLARQAR
jgi:hypothetical protein